MTITLQTEVKNLKGVGPAKAAGLARLRIKTVEELLHHFPSGYFFAPVPGILRENIPGTYIGTVVCITRHHPGSRDFGVVLDGKIDVIWFGGQYLRSQIFKGTRLMVSGVVKLGSFFNPEFRVLKPDETPDLSMLNTVTYPVVAGITSKDIGRLVRQVLDTLYAEGTATYDSATWYIHRPANQDQLDRAQSLLKYDELFYMQLGLAIRRAKQTAEQANVRCNPCDQINIARYFPFNFTTDQWAARCDIVGDLCQSRPMNRLLQGDVGCVSAETEFLSTMGWVPISEWSGQQVMQYDTQTGIAEFVTPLRYIKAPCSEFIRIHTKYGVSQVLSPEHRCLAYKFSKITGEYDRAVEISAAELEEEHNRSKLGFRGRFETAFSIRRKSSVPLTDAQLRVMTMVCADGHIADKTSVVISIKKLRKIVRAKQLLAEAGIDYSETTSAGYTRLRFAPPVLRKGIEQFWAASPGQLRVIADEVVFWDGDQGNAFYTRRKPEADFVQYAFSACGYRASICSYPRGDKTDYVVFRYAETKTGLMANPKSTITRVPSSDGYKYCFTVPSSYLVLRHDGRVFITGNCGKTAIAAYAAIVMAFNGGQTAILCPTEVLARQHYETIRGYFDRAGVRCELRVAGWDRPRRSGYQGQMVPLAPDIVIGTTAMLADNAIGEPLGLVIIDEQHKFGVEQRAMLKRHGNPHMLMMTATPIPRTLAMTVFGDLDVSTIKSMPPGRSPVITKWVKRSDWIDHVFQEKLHDELAAGHQVYVVCPRIEALDDEMRAVDEVAIEYTNLFPGTGVGILHGKMHPTDRQKIMDEFKANGFEILVSTTVIEVGVDNPNATVMVVEGAERFGLASLHQLRGRVGRGEAQSYCFLLSDSDSAEAKARLRAMEQTNDGFSIAEQDLKLRGIGDLLGSAQHGLPPLRIADIVDDFDILLEAHKDAQDLVAKGPLPKHIHDELERRYGGKLYLANA